MRVWNDRGELQLPMRLSTRVRPGVVAVPWGWWANQYPDSSSTGPVANSLTNDTLTDRGGGVAFWDTQVALSPL